MNDDLELLPDGSVRALEAMAGAFEARSVRYAVIGGLAFMRRGRPRFTKDVDLLIDVPQVALPGLLDDLIGRGFSIDPAVVIPQYVRQHITSFSFGGVRIDWLKPVLPLYARALADATPVEWSEGHPVRMVTAEGLILTKMVAFRPQDRVDITTLLTANRDAIDLGLIRDEWSPLAATETERTSWLEAEIERLVVRRE